MKNQSPKIIKRLSALKNLFIPLSFFAMAMIYGQAPKIKIIITPNQSGTITAIIQKAIDSCEANGGGVVFFPAGKYITGGIELKSKVILLTMKGSLIEGSSQYSDYKNDALIFGENLTDIAIEGEGTIDGVDCKNANGEEGFRGPHCIQLINCKNISIKGITIKNSANWAINCRYCSYAVVENVSIRAGHDGLHTRFCNDFKVTGCDFRTGDDAFAGNDNQKFTITDCKINTSCNGFRMGCLNFTVKRCKFWGPGEYMHVSQRRNNMLSAFVQFSPKDENPKLPSGNWLIEDITVENVDNFYRYNYIDGLWQTGQPATSLQFKNIKATGLLSAFNIIGDTARKFNLSIQNSSFAYREGIKNLPDSFEGVKVVSKDFFYAGNFNEIKLQNITLEKKTVLPVLSCTKGNSLILNQVQFKSDKSAVPYSTMEVNKIVKDGLLLHNSEKVYEIKAGNSTMKVSANGGRILSYKMGAIELITSEQQHENFGSTLWTAPQSNWGWPPYPVLDSDEYQVEKLGDTLKMMSAADDKSGLQFEKRWFPLGKNAIQIEYKIRNISSQEKAVGAWEVTRVPCGGIALFPNGGQGNIPISSLKLSLKQKGINWIRINKNKIMAHEKLFSTASEGWLAYTMKGLLFIKQFPDTKPKAYSPEQGEVEIYIDKEKSYAELENHGPYLRLQAGESLSYVVNWHLVQIPPAVNGEKGNIKLAAYCRNLMNKPNN